MWITLTNPCRIWKNPYTYPVEIRGISTRFFHLFHIGTGSQFCVYSCIHMLSTWIVSIKWINHFIEVYILSLKFSEFPGGKVYRNENLRFSPFEQVNCSSRMGSLRAAPLKILQVSGNGLGKIKRFRRGRRPRRSSVSIDCYI